MQLANRRAVITGASRGIGLAIATALAREGVDISICARSAQAL
ncbi:3-oxoacyl-ACP reductase [Salinisphaera sp. S4-8]